ncbi:MAG: acetamidase/formamidase family protein [Chloroflexi bacterium]|nr:acetamidase/formamidase family protein [Chloroflexota bacterium]
MGQIHEIYADRYYRTFSRAHPVLLRVKPGDTVRTRTVDSGGQDEKGERKSEPGNPLTGSFYVEGAEPGDAILVRFDRIRCNRNWGYTSYRLGLWALSPDSIEGIYSNQYRKDLIRPGRADIVPWDIDVKSGHVNLREPKTKAAKLEFQARPMLGCVGVAPAGDFAPTSGPSGPYGGNIDYNEIAEGSTVSLPVYHPGALLFVGDGHAVQGDGEPLGTGVETSMDVEFTVELRKKYSLNGPRVETADNIISVGSQPEFASALDRGLQMATSDMVRWLGTDYKMEPWEAHLLIGMVGRYDVVTVAGSMALRIAKRYLPTRA